MSRHGRRGRRGRPVVHTALDSVLREATQLNWLGHTSGIFRYTILENQLTKDWK